MLIGTGRRSAIHLREWVPKDSPVKGDIVRAVLVHNIGSQHVSDHLRHWSPLLDQYRGAQGDGDWDWMLNILEQHEAVDEGRATSCTGFAIEADGVTQGLMLVRVGEHANLTAQLDDRLVYVAYLATAPWNRDDLVATPAGRPFRRLSGVGTALIRAAIVHSHEAGLDGRVGLHGLEDALGFYQKACYFTYLGLEVLAKEEPYPWLELPAVSAHYFLGSRPR